MTLIEAQTLLATYANFDEAILLGYQSTNLLRDIQIIVNPVRTESGELRPNLDEPLPTMLTFRSCQAIEIVNDFSSEHLSDAANWGLSEFSMLRVEELNGLLMFTFSWEVSRTMKITCSELAITAESEEIAHATSNWLRAELRPVLEL